MTEAIQTLRTSLQESVAEGLMTKDQAQDTLQKTCEALGVAVVTL